MKDDLISRQDAIEALRRAEALTRAFGYHYVIDTIVNLPSAEPERKKGKWVEKMRPTSSQKAAVCECSICLDTVWKYDGDRGWNFCPNCGAEMESYQ